MSRLDQMLADCLSYESRRKELATRCILLIERCDEMIARLRGDAPTERSVGDDDNWVDPQLSPIDTDAVPDLNRIWRDLIQHEWEVLDLRRDLEAEGML
jgi:hypothetical protein